MTGSWYAAARVAHLHVNVLGWGGLTLLATIVFFGPTVMRARMEPEAGETAAIHLRRAATGLAVATVALLATGAGGAAVVPARLWRPPGSLCTRSARPGSAHLCCASVIERARVVPHR